MDTTTKLTAEEIAMLRECDAEIERAIEARVRRGRRARAALVGDASNASDAADRAVKRMNEGG